MTFPRISSLFAVIALVVPVFAAKDRIAANPVSGRSAVLRNSTHPRALPQLDRGAADPAMPIAYATLQFRAAPGLDAFLASQQNPGSPEYRRWLTPEQFGDRFGLSGNDIDKVVAWLKARGFTVHDIARGRQWITFSGTAGDVSQAFRAEIHQYLVDGAMHFANSGPLSIPAEFEAVVSGVSGLDDFGPDAQHRVHGPVEAPDYTSGSFHYLAPDDVATVYNISQLYQAGIDGTGQKIAIIGRTDVDLADIRNFRQRFGLSAVDPQIILFGADPGTTSDVVEADLDLEWSGAVARNATIIYVNSANIRTAAQYAVDQNVAPVMTYSYGSCEAQTTDTQRSVAQQANAQGITWMVSSGDSGAAACDRNSATPQGSKGLTASYPATIPEITAVGGTEFSEGSSSFWGRANATSGGSALSYIPEVVWNDSILENAIVGGGGGASQFYPKPWWQTGAGVPNDGARDVPDVSFASSAAHDGYLIVSGGALKSVGGTSVASPVFAGMVSLLNQSLTANGKIAAPGLGNINPALYRMAGQGGIFHDITVGDNKVLCQQGSPDCVNGIMGYNAAAGYDLATGLGSVDTAQLIAGWNSGVAATTTVSANPQSPAPTDTVTLSATVKGDGGTPSGSVSFIANDTEVGRATLNGGAASVAVPAINLAGGDGTVSALYSGDSRFAVSQGSAKVTLKVPAAGSFVVASVSPNPVYEYAGSWPYTLTLTQKADVPTTITTFTVDGVSNLSLLSTTGYAGLFSFSLSLTGHLAAPATRQFHFAGVDASGAPWSSDLSVPFLGPEAPALIPGIAVTASPSSIQQDPGTDPSCQWKTAVSMQETGGYGMSLTRFTSGTVNLTSSISQIFGTTRLAPYGRLTGTVCISDATAPGTRAIAVSGTAENGTAGTVTVTVSLAGPASVTTPMTASPSTVVITGGGANVDPSFRAGSPAWNARVVTSGYSDWLTISPASGTGNATLSLQNKNTRLSNGVYNALLVVESPNAIPQSIQIPVALVVGGGTDTAILGVNSAASATQAFAPGMWMAVYGKNLAPSTQLANVVPLNLSLAGVSATVNGIAAPLWFVGSGQMNIQIPYETSVGTAVLGVNNNGAMAAFTFPVSPVAPGIFDTSLTGKPGQTIVAYISGEGDVTPTLATGTIPPAGTKLANFPQPRQSISITVAGEQANIAFAGVVSLIGATQVNFTIPADVPPGVQPVVVTVGGVASPPVKMTVTAP